MVLLDTCAEDMRKLAGMRRDILVDKSSTLCESLCLVLCPNLYRNQILFQIQARDS